jgi:transposase-like protein
MGRKVFSSEQIINHLRRSEVLFSEGKSTGEVCRSIGISPQSYYRWRKEYGGLQVSQVKRLKSLEKENQRLKRAVADLTLDKLILKEASEGNY